MAAGTAVYPGSGNTYIKNHQATGNLVVSFSRNPKEFAFTRYAQYRTVKKDAGYYLRITAENAARIVGANLKEFVWPDGADRPTRNSGTEKFAFHDYKTARYDYDFTLGYKSREQADWNIQDIESSFHIQQAMTGRGVSIADVLQTTGNWDASHILDVDDGGTDVPGNTSGQSWELSTSQRQDIKRSLNVGTQLIRNHTLGKVKRKDLQLVMSPNTAMRLGESQEIIDFVKQAPDSWKMIQGDLSGLNSEFGMPDMLYGIPIVVDDTVLVSSARGAATATYANTLTDGNVFLLSRVGGIDSPGGGPSFSTLTGFFYEELTVETKDDPDNRRVNGHVVDDFQFVLTAPASGVFFRGTVE